MLSAENVKKISDETRAEIINSKNMKDWLEENLSNINQEIIGQASKGLKSAYISLEFNYECPFWEQEFKESIILEKIVSLGFNISNRSFYCGLAPYKDKNETPHILSFNINW